jgi:hypothetical protein
MAIPSEPPSNVRDLAAIRVAYRAPKERREAREAIANLAYQADVAEARRDHVAKDPLVRAVGLNNADSVDVLKAVRAEIAREQAEMHFQRLEAEKRGIGRDPKLSKTRIDALVKIAQIESEIRKFGAEALDFKSPKFQKVFALWVEAIKEVAVELFTPEQVDLFFNRLGTKLDGWEDRVSDTLR